MKFVIAWISTKALVHLPSWFISVRCSMPCKHQHQLHVTSGVLPVTWSCVTDSYKTLLIWWQLLCFRCFGTFLFVFDDFVFISSLDFCCFMIYVLSFFFFNLHVYLIFLLGLRCIFLFYWHFAISFLFLFHCGWVDTDPWKTSNHVVQAEQCHETKKNNNSHTIHWTNAPT